MWAVETTDLPVDFPFSGNFPDAIPSQTVTTSRSLAPKSSLD
jgi:hypothetical protein